MTSEELEIDTIKELLEAESDKIEVCSSQCSSSNVSIANVSSPFL